MWDLSFQVIWGPCFTDTGSLLPNFSVKSTIYKMYNHSNRHFRNSLKVIYCNILVTITITKFNNDCTLIARNI